MNARSEANVRIGAATGLGSHREVNEDALLTALLFGSALVGDVLDEVRDGLVLGVFDGCGGVGSGRVASDLTAETVLSTLRTIGPERCRDALGDALEASLVAANEAVYQRTRDDRTTRGMGTTATVAACVDDVLHVAHVGDSRAYLLRDGRLVQVSRDQTLLNKLIVEGKILPEEIADFPHRHVVVGAVGVGDSLVVDHATVQLRRGDLLLMCTDGLHRQVTPSAVARTISSLRTPTQMCVSLLEEANEAGGDDNATVVIASFDGDWLTPCSPNDELADRNQLTPPRGAVSYRTAFSAGDDGPAPA